MIEDGLNRALQNLAFNNPNHTGPPQQMDRDTVNQMIESHVHGALSSCTSAMISNPSPGCGHNSSPGTNNTRSRNNLGNEPILASENINIQSIHPTGQSNPPNSLGNNNRPIFNLPPPNRFACTSAHLPNSQLSTFSTDKITSIIQSWFLKFDGSPTGLNVEEFLYRLKSLTKDNFNSDFSVICKNLHILLSGKARDWFWRYHKLENGNIDWNEFCSSIRSQYKYFKSTFDIKEELRNRKQKPAESFDAFFEAVSSITDRLSSPISDMELIEIITRNLRPEIRKELLYVPIHSIPHLRKLVQMRETFFDDESIKRNFSNKFLSPNVARRHVAEVDLNLDR